MADARCPIDGLPAYDLDVDVMASQAERGVEAWQPPSARTIAVHVVMLTVLIAAGVAAGRVLGERSGYDRARREFAEAFDRSNAEWQAALDAANDRARQAELRRAQIRTDR